MNEVGSHEIDIFELIEYIGTKMWFIILATFAGGLTALLIAMQMPNIYRSQALLAPVDDSNGQGLSRIAGQFGSLASLAGVDLRGGSSSKVAIGLEALRSRVFIVDFIRRRDIQAELLTAVGWDETSQKLIMNDKRLDRGGQSWVSDDASQSFTSSDWDTYKAFTERLTVSQDKDTGFVTVAFDFYSPVDAQLWVAWLIEDINNYMRDMDVKEANSNIAYLKDQLVETSWSDVRQVFYQLIEKQLQTVMLAKAREQYLFRIIDPPVIAIEPIRPQRIIISVLSGILAGGMTFVFFALTCFFQAARRQRSQQPS